MNRKTMVSFKITIALLFLMPVFFLSCGGKKVSIIPPHKAEAHDDLIRGNTWYMKGCLSKAAIYFDMALERFSAYDDLNGVATCLNNLASLSRIQKDLKTALMYLDDSERIFKQINRPMGYVRVLSNKAAVYLDMDRVDEAETILDQAEKLARGNSITFLPLSSNRILLLIRKNEIDQARSLLDQTLLSASSDDAFNWGTLQHAAGVLEEAAKQYEKALAHYNAALSSDRKHYFLRGIAEDLTATGRVYLAMGRTGDALDVLYRSMKVRTLLADAADIEETSDLLKQCLTILGDSAPDNRITETMLKIWAKGDTVAAPCE